MVEPFLTDVQHLAENVYTFGEAELDHFYLAYEREHIVLGLFQSLWVGLGELEVVDCADLFGQLGDELVDLFVAGLGWDDQELGLDLGAHRDKQLLEVLQGACVIVQWQHILIEYNTLPLQHPNPLGKLLLIDPPQTRIAHQHLPVNKLPILLKVINQVFQEFTPETQLRRPRILLPHKITNPHFQIIIVNAMPAQDYLVEGTKDLDQSITDLFYVGRDEDVLVEVPAFEGLGFGVVLLAHFLVQVGDALHEDHQQAGEESHLGDLVDEQAKTVLADFGG